MPVAPVVPGGWPRKGPPDIDHEKSSPALSMKRVPLRAGTTENPLGNEDH